MNVNDNKWVMCDSYRAGCHRGPRKAVKKFFDGPAQLLADQLLCIGEAMCGRIRLKF